MAPKINSTTKTKEPKVCSERISTIKNNYSQEKERLKRISLRSKIEAWINSGNVSERFDVTAIPSKSHGGVNTVNESDGEWYPGITQFPDTNVEHLSNEVPAFIENGTVDSINVTSDVPVTTTHVITPSFQTSNGNDTEETTGERDTEPLDLSIKKAMSSGSILVPCTSDVPVTTTHVISPSFQTSNGDDTEETTGERDTEPLDLSIKKAMSSGSILVPYTSDVPVATTHVITPSFQTSNGDDTEETTGERDTEPLDLSIKKAMSSVPCKQFDSNARKQPNTALMQIDVSVGLMQNSCQIQAATSTTLHAKPRKRRNVTRKRKFAITSAMNSNKENKVIALRHEKYAYKAPVAILEEILNLRQITPTYNFTLKNLNISNQQIFQCCVSFNKKAAFGFGMNANKAKKAAATSLMDLLFRETFFGNSIGRLQELCMARHWPLPNYKIELVFRSEGEHQFLMSCAICKFKEFGYGKNKKIAKHLAAYKMWTKMNEKC